MTLTDKQKKALMVAGAVLGIIHYAPSIVSSVRERSAAYRAAHEKPSPITAPARASSAPPPPVVAAPPHSPEEVRAEQLSKLAGAVWSGSLPVSGVGICEIRLELKSGTEKPGFTGFSTMSCANVQRFRPGQRSNAQNTNKAILDATPVSAVLSGVIENGSIELHRDTAYGADSAGCNVIGFSLSPFAEQMGAKWKEGLSDWKENPRSVCPAGEVIMHRVRGL
jgi:hypothetical protein